MKYFTLYIDEVKGKQFTYKGEKGKYNIGDWVKVKFGKKEKIGLIIFEEEKKRYEYEIKEIQEKIIEQPSIPREIIKLLLWISEYYLADLKDVISAAYPKDLKMKYYEYYVFQKPIIPLNENEQEFLEYMQKKEEITVTTLKKHFEKELIEKFEKNGIIKLIKKSNLKKRKIKKNQYIKTRDSVTKLTKEQNEVKDEIINLKNRFYLLKGITGSGKTEVYIEVIKDAVKKDCGAMFLVPEISLTPQMISRFTREFSNTIAILHSRMTPKERADEWYSLYMGEKKIVLGVRSAVFAPVQNLKYLIIDEEQETTYKQDTNPRYNAKFVAIKRVELENAKLIFGTATPSIETYNYAKNGIFKLLELNNRFNNVKMPKVKIVDMKKEKNGILSYTLLEEISDRLRKKEQVLIFLNKKGFSSFVQCKDCGEIEHCPHCSVSLSYYKYKNILKCNYCGYTKKFEAKCIKCGSRDLKYYGQGTEKVEMELQKYFKSARILRVDSETVKEKGSYKRIYEDFLNNKYDILLGTQIIAKGFHFPNITLVGIISADSTLNFPDFRAGEKTFNLIVQASGRAGRAEKEGEVIIQTYTPDHYVIEKSKKADYEKLYEEEIEVRKELNYPPFGKIINIIISSEEEEILEKEAQAFLDDIFDEELEIYGPFQAPLYKIKKRYRYQIFIKGSRKQINKYKLKLNEKYKKVRNKKVRITIDVDPINLM